MTRLIVLPLLFAFAAVAAQASDACSTVSVRTAAKVEVSDGSRYEVQTRFHSRDAATVEFRGDNPQLIVTEGPRAWWQRGDQVGDGNDALRTFVLGHQFHALLLHVADIVDNFAAEQSYAANGFDGTARGGELPGRARLLLIDAQDSGRTERLILELPEQAPMSATFTDWRPTPAGELPFRMLFDDGARRFDYRWDEVEVGPRDPQWFMDEVSDGGHDDIAIYRAHRRMLAAHCAGDARLLADLSGPAVVVVSRGSVYHTTAEAMQAQFAGLFERLDYTAYTDLSPPHIQIADDGHSAWMAVQVRAEGRERRGGRKFDDQWAWIMQFEKSDDGWRHVANASNRQP